MFIPLRDENRPGALFPVVNWSLIIINVLMFLLQLTSSAMTYSLSMVPHEILTGKDLVGPVVVSERGAPWGERITIPHEPGPKPIYLTLLTSMFLHGNWFHLLGNMLFLWIFGDNLEDAMGRVRYLFYYLTCGILADVVHILLNTQPPYRYIPTLGASGAISGVLGGYMVLFPNSQVTGILFRAVVTLPAWVALGMWFIYQLIMAGIDMGGGVAYGAHIGGFLAGAGLVFVFGQRSDYRSYYRRANSW
jgi:membrane associated rhomboid family serine protease